MWFRVFTAGLIETTYWKAFVCPGAALPGFRGPTPALLVHRHALKAVIMFSVSQCLKHFGISLAEGISLSSSFAFFIMI